MPRITIKLKIGAGFAVAGLMLVICGLAGLYLSASVSTSLGIFTGPVMQTTANANVGMLGVQSQLIAVQDILSDNNPEAKGRLTKAEQESRTSLKGIIEAGRIDKELTSSLSDKMDSFAKAKDSLLDNHSKFVLLEEKIQKTVASLLDFIIDIERLSSNSLLDSQLLLEGIKDTIDSEAFASYSYNAASKLEEEQEEKQNMVDNDKDLINSSGEARLALLNRLTLLTNFRASPNDIDVKKRLDQVYEDLAFAGEIISENKGMQELKVKGGAYADKSYAEVMMLLIKQHDNDFKASMELFVLLKTSKVAYSKEADALIAFGQTLLSNISESVVEERTALSGVLEAGTQIIYGVLAVGLILGLVILIVTVKAITDPINRVREQMEDIAAGEGDLTIRLDIKGQDEVADLAIAFNSFTGKLRGIIQLLQNHIAQLVDATAVVHSVSEQTQAQTLTQQDELGRVVVAINDLALSSSQVVTNTSEASGSAQQANEQAHSGLQMMQSIVQTIEAVASDVEGTSIVVDDLADKSDQIGVVLDVIRGISEQTNLLALNAAIEAARAGEQGRGFAVVADEVRGLAGRTHDSISQIQEIISQLQSGTANVTTKMKIVKENAVNSVDPVKEASQTLELISQAVNGITELNGQIASAAETQSNTATAVDTNINNINNMASESTENAGMLLDAANTLTGLGDELQQLASQFKVN